MTVWIFIKQMCLVSFTNSNKKVVTLQKWEGEFKQYDDTGRKKKKEKANLYIPLIFTTLSVKEITESGASLSFSVFESKLKTILKSTGVHNLW